MQILVVEDEALIAELLVECLEDAGHTVIGPAATAKDALHLCTGFTPDLAILDISLADGSSGIEVARELFSRPGVAIIFASGELKIARQVEGAALSFLPKPYQMVELFRSMEAMGAMQPRSAPHPAPQPPSPFADLHNALIDPNKHKSAMD
jgi:DNA-binding response OmpR family regulator